MTIPLVPPNFILCFAIYDALKAKVTRLVYTHVEHVAMDTHLLNVVVRDELTKGTGLNPSLYPTDIFLELWNSLANETTHCLLPLSLFLIEFS